jgi:hypothetical protein
VGVELPPQAATTTSASRNGECDRLGIARIDSSKSSATRDRR